MSDEQIKKIDEFSEWLVTEGREGRLNGFYTSTYTGSVQKELSYLREALLNQEPA